MTTIQRKAQNPRNFFQSRTLPVGHVTVAAAATSVQAFFALRSLPGVGLDAIPRRFSSSSLPPSFVAGRFAGFSYATGRGV